MPVPKKSITLDDLYRMQVLANVRISPDGEHVIYTLQRVDRETESKYSNLWVAPTAGGEVRQFTQGDQPDVMPRWSHDGSQIAFLSKRNAKEKTPQIYLIAFSGGEAHKLTSIDGEIREMQWSPDGRKLLCAIRKTDSDQLNQSEQQKKLGVVARHYDRLFYKLDGEGYLPHERTHLWLIDARTGKAKQLTDHAIWDEFNPTFSPDGKTIAFCSNHASDPDLDPYAVDLFVISADGGEPRKLKAPEGSKKLASFSPDGKFIAYLGIDGKGLDYRNECLWIAPADGSKSAKNLIEKYDFEVSGMVINDFGTPETMPPVWSNDGKRVYFQVGMHGSSLLKSIALDGEDLRDVVGEGGMVSGFSFDKMQSKVAYHFGQMDDPGQVYVREVESGTTRILTRINREVLDRSEMSKVEEVWFRGSDKNFLQGWIMKPPSFNPRKKYPSILYIHGGPLTQYGKLFFHEFEVLAANGYVVYFCNPRGGKGYGEEHAAAIWGAWGTADYDDLMAWTDYMEKQPYIDRERMGVTGGSYGGYMTLWIIGHTKRFQAAITDRCVSNFISEWGSSDLNWTFEYEVEAEPPYKDFKKWWDLSPMKYIGNAKTPTLVQHYENDLRCPIEQGEQVFVALKRLDVDTEFVRYPDEFHGMSRTGRTDRRVERIKHILRWFDKYLK